MRQRDGRVLVLGQQRFTTAAGVGGQLCGRAKNSRSRPGATFDQRPLMVAAGSLSSSTMKMEPFTSSLQRQRDLETQAAQRCSERPEALAARPGHIA